MALAVLIFHFNKWTTETWNPYTLFGKLGVYAVAIFFILSGMTLTMVYRHSLMPQPRSWLRFWEKRFWRIFPLFWLATAATAAIDNPKPTLNSLLLNFSGLFSFFQPDGDIATGAWSIGNELVYYAFFPAIIWISGRQKWQFSGINWCLTAIFFATLCINLFISFSCIDSQMPIKSQWYLYVHPVHAAFFFTGGMWLAWHGEWVQKMPFPKFTALLLAITFSFFPVHGDPVQLIYGWNRLIISTLCLGLCACCWAVTLHLPTAIQRALTWLGAISYSLYLLHPLVFRTVKSVFVQMHLENPALWLPVAVIVSGLAGHASYFFMEKPIMAYFSKRPPG